MCSDPPHRERASHGYDLHDAGTVVARLEWRTAPRSALGWYVVRPQEAEVRLRVDAAIDELARDRRSSVHDWELNAELSAILSTPMALDAAERVLQSGAGSSRGRFRRRRPARRFELYVTDISSTTLAHAVPELPLDSVADVSLLAGQLSPDALEVVLRRITLLGGRVIAFLER